MVTREPGLVSEGRQGLLHAWGNRTIGSYNLNKDDKWVRRVALVARVPIFDGDTLGAGRKTTRL